MLMLPSHIHYKAADVLLIFHRLSQYLHSEPFSLQAEGVFRISGTQSHCQEIIEHILKNERFTNEKYSIHDYIGALKFALTHYTLINKLDPYMLQLKESINSDTIEEAADNINNFIKTWASSDEKQKFCAAELLYTYLHIGTNALIFSSKNRMTAENIGIVVGPTLANLLEDDPLKILPLIHRFNKISEYILQKGYYRDNFDTSFPRESQSMRKKMLAELEKERLNILQAREIYAEKLCQYQAEASQMESLLTNTSGMNRKERKRHKQEIEYSLSQKKMAIRMLKKDDKDNHLKQLFEIELQIEELQSMIFDVKLSKLLVFSLRRTNSFIAPIPETQTLSLSQLAEKRKSPLLK